MPHKGFLAADHLRPSEVKEQSLCSAHVYKTDLALCNQMQVIECKSLNASH